MCDIVIIPCSQYARKVSTKSIVRILTLEEIFVVALFVLLQVHCSQDMNTKTLKQSAISRKNARKRNSGETEV
jgi:hypothetical protein